MVSKLIYALILTVLPISELRIGLPLAMSYSIEQGIPLIYIFSLVLLLNIVVIFFVFYFLDNLHKIFLKNQIYKKGFENYIKKFQKRIDKFERKYESLGFFALVLFVAVPLPGTGAWSGSLLAWLLNLDRKKSVVSIALGIIIAGLIIFLGSFGFFSIFK